MKDFFSNKLNIFLSFLLLLIIGVSVWFALSLFGNPFDKSVVAINFSNMNKSEVEKWVSDNNLDKEKYRFSYQYDESIEKDYVVYQSVKEGEAIKDYLTIVYSDGKDPSGIIDIASQIKNMSSDNAKKWFLSNEYTNVTFLYEISDTYEFGKLISVNPANATKNDSITVTYSLGKTIEDIVTTVPNFSTYTEDEIREWAKQYAIDLTIKFEEHDLAKEGEFISQSLSANSEIKGGDSITITLSSGKGNDNYKTIPDSYLNLSEADFIAKLKDLGFNNLSKSNTAYYAESIEKDHVYSYDDGNFSTSRTINYALSLGKYVFNASDFNDKTKNDVEKLVASLQNKNAKIEGKLISISFTDGDKNEEKAGKAYDCSVNKNAISCKLYISDNSTSATIPTDGRYLGKSENDFLNETKKLGFTNFKKSDITYFSTTLAAGTLYSYDDGSIALNKVINYALSAGAYSFNASDFNGKTKDEATKTADDYKNRNAASGSLNIRFTNGDANNDLANKTYDCSYSSSTISCKVYTGKGSSSTSATIPTDGRYLGKSEDSFLNDLKKLGFTNFNKSNTTYFSTTLAAGTLYSYDDGQFSLDKTINYALSAGAYSFNADEFNGKTKDEATNVANAYKNRNAASGALSIRFTNGDTNNDLAGKTYSCSYSGSTISCYVYVKENTPTVNNADMLSLGLIAQNYKGNTYDETKTKAANYFSGAGFTNVSFQETTSTKAIYSISSITVNGNEHSGAASYPVDSKIVVTIVSKNP